MALTITRPIGRRFGAPAKTATVDNSFNYARFTSTAHGLTTGDFLVVENSPVPSYNGIWYADVNDANEYFIRPAAGVDFVLWVADATVTVRGEDLEHMWSAVHLPIVYEVTTTLFPFNTASALSIISIDNDNGYARLRLSSSLTIYPLEFIRITSATSPELNGIFQVQAVTTLNRVTIDLTYKGTYNQAGAQVRKYYSNYALIVRVYAGITGALAVKKPVELAATLKFIPDNDNTVRFSVSEILKSYVKLRNGIGDDTMPNQLDFLTEFYVTYQETYDYSFGYTLLRFDGDITSDEEDYSGFAVNAKLAFGNVYSGYLSEYLMNTTTAKFLTLFAIPTLFACEDSEPCYQDISYIETTGGGTIQRDYFKDGVVGITTEDTIPAKGPGVYRIPIQEPGINTCYYDSMRVTLIDDTPQAPFELTLGSQVNPPQGSGTTWIDDPGAEEFLNAISGSFYVTKIMYDEVNILSGTYTFSYRLTKDNATTTVSFWLVALDDNLTVIDQQLIVAFSDAATHINTMDFNLPAAKYVGVYASMPFGLGTSTDVYITDFTLDTDIYPRESESKIFNIDCGCSAQQIKLTWVNNLGGCEYWTFKAEKDYMTEVTETQTSEKNILPSWPQSYGHTADTLRYETVRVSRRQIIVRSQNGLTRDEAFAISYIKSSPLVQIIDSAGRRTVTVDTNSLRITGDGDKLREIEFTITETGDIPAQTA